MYVEVIYETGNKSVAQYADEDEARQALEAHHNRATSGEMGGPYGGPAERIKKVLMYDEHPADFGSTGLISADEAKTQLSELVDSIAVGDQVSNMELAASVRELTNPHTNPEGPLDSQYKATETGELEGAWS